MNSVALTDNPEFVGFEKIPRLNRNCIITEKIDGTNGVILVNEDGTYLVGSKSRWLDPDAKQGDNFGFARWVRAREALLPLLGPGRHFGEFWGSGIQRGYGKVAKYFSLFNVTRWRATLSGEVGQQLREAGIDVVPTLYEGLFTTDTVVQQVNELRAWGSKAAPGYDKPEGVIIWHEAGRHLYKVTLDKDEERKGTAYLPGATPTAGVPKPIVAAEVSAPSASSS